MWFKQHPPPPTHTGIFGVTGRFPFHDTVITCWFFRSMHVTVFYGYSETNNALIFRVKHMGWLLDFMEVCSENNNSPRKLLPVILYCIWRLINFLSIMHSNSQNTYGALMKCFGDDQLKSTWPLNSDFTSFFCGSWCWHGNRRTGNSSRVCFSLWAYSKHLSIIECDQFHSDNRGLRPSNTASPSFFQSVQSISIQILWRN